MPVAGVLEEGLRAKAKAALPELLGNCSAAPVPQAGTFMDFEKGKLASDKSLLADVFRLLRTLLNRDKTSVAALEAALEDGAASLARALAGRAPVGAGGGERPVARVGDTELVQRCVQSRE